MAHEKAFEIVMPGGSDFLAMGVVFVAAFVTSFLWWGPLFGKKWAGLVGLRFDPDNRPPMGKPMLLQAIGTVFLTYVFWNVLHVFVVTHDADGLVRGDLSIVNALTGAFFTWLGFFVIVQLGQVAWENRPWALFFINAGGWLVQLAVMALLFALMPT